MRSTKRLLALCLCIILTLTCVLCSCGGYKPIEPDAEDLTVVGQVNGRDVYMEELRFVAYTYRHMMTARYGEDIFTGAEKEKYLEMLRELVYDNITSNYATVELCEEALISLGETAVTEKVTEEISTLVDELGGMRKYKKYLKENNLTDHFLRFSTEISLLQSELMYVYIDDILVIEDDDEKLYDLIMDEFIVVRHVFIPHTDAEAKTKIGSAAQRLSAGEDFSVLISELGQDPDMTAEGLFILEGYMSEDYESAAFALKVGEVSDIVEDNNGYYLIQRLEMSIPDVMLRFDYIKQLYQTYTFYSIIDKKQTELTFVPNDAGTAYMSDPFN